MSEAVTLIVTLFEKSWSGLIYTSRWRKVRQIPRATRGWENGYIYVVINGKTETP